MRRTRAYIVVFLWLSLAMGTVACRSEPATTIAPNALSDLADVALLQDRFNAGAGTPRPLLILAPT